MIPKIIWTAWLSENGAMPPMIKKCIESQKIAGYEHKILDIDSAHAMANPYIDAAIAKKNWAKATDMIRFEILYRRGGIFMGQVLEN